MLNAKSPSPEKTREHLERIDRQVNMIDSVVTALSDVAKLPNADLNPTSITEVLTKSANAIGLPSSITVEFELPENFPLAMADENQMVIAVKNLIRNARDAMPDGGRLALTGGFDDETVSFSVQDSGTGIRPEDVTKILEPLFTTKARGMGLGLSIVRAIVEKNKGYLGVESTFGEGSCFTITLRRFRDH